MNISVVIPTYWARKKSDPHQESDAVYDHPTPLDGEETLGRTLESMKILNNKNFKLIIPLCPTTEEIEEEAEERVRSIVDGVGLDIDTYLFTPQNLREIKSCLGEAGLAEEVTDFLSIKGYSNVRNICLYSSYILSSEVTILIDDDEVFEKPEWIDMAVEFIGKRMYGKSIYAMAGYYLNKYDEFYDDVDIVPWMTYWDRFGSKTKAFDKIIASEPRIKITPFAFGGAMVMHKNLFKQVPFDPEVTRGEDIDYLINAKMFGYDFFLDNQLSIKHLPPKKSHPVWKRFREDIYRFLYERQKIETQTEVSNMHEVEASDFNPYPGDFLTDDLEDMIYKTNVLLSMEYLSEGDIESARESIRNIYLSKYEAVPKFNVFEAYRKKQKKWETIIDMTRQERPCVRKIMEKNNLSKIAHHPDNGEYEGLTPEKIKECLCRVAEFNALDDDELDRLSKVFHAAGYNENEALFKDGEENLRFFVVLRGCVRIVEFSRENEEVQLAKICSGGVIGETFLLKDSYNTTGIADEFVEVVWASKEDLKALIEEDDPVGKKLLYMFLDRLYYKLNTSNQLYKEIESKAEDISNM